MKITQYSSTLWQLTRYPAVFPMNCYLIREDDGLTLIDSTMSSPADDVATLAAKLGIALKRIVLTHAHGDHVGGVGGVRARFPGLTVAIGERDGRLLAGDLSPLPGEPQVPAKGFFSKLDWTPDQLLKAGDRVGSLEVVPAPGHTPGQVAFLDVRDRALIVGDALQTRGGVAVSGVIRPLFPFPAMATWHKPTALATAESLRQLQPSLLGVGHGNALTDPGAPLDAAIEVARRAFA